MVFSYFLHKKTVAAKQKEREDRINDLPEYKEPLTEEEKSILSQEASKVIAKVQAGEIKPISVLRAYGKRALESQPELNAITEIFIKDSEKWAEHANTKGPLAGFPITFKDTINVTGYDSCIGYSSRSFKPAVKDAPIVKLLKDAGAVPMLKTNVPFTLLSFESYNDVWGVTSNPYHKDYAPGGSTGGEAALLAYGGSRLGVGTDVAGSVRVPAHFSGIYSLKCSTGRFPKIGNTTSMAGQEGIPAVYSPMTRSLPDLGFFLKTIIDMKPWEYDYSVHPIPWRKVDLPAKLKVGVIYDDGVVTPSPACARALDLTIDALEKQGHSIVKFDAPDPLRCLRIASQLLCSDAGRIATRGQLWGENNDAGVGRMLFAQRLPRFVKKIYAWILQYIYRDPVWAYMVRDWNEKTITERWDLVAEREQYKLEFFEAWKESGIDILLTVPNATPALPHKGLYESISSCGYTFMFNLLDYSAGVLPVTRVDKEKDQLPPGFNPNKLNRIAKGAYDNYDATKMHGLPVGVQVVGQRLEEEKVIKAMEVVEDALHKSGVVYVQRNS
ncbi:Amd2p [Sugiyamaella lignohabitans]|uniref:amidase n=1 Tax=Sugiyamaella lignohabitans TaxID=796027 RepID=A0A167E9G2_9ASCO|nr:Amd2p [Sugiyamaella lignohabitans]ANB13804.1 Amd2p [Sugiyamaella lignohabitans]